jgi:hypothetical protein
MIGERIIARGGKHYKGLVSRRGAQSDPCRTRSGQDCDQCPSDDLDEDDRRERRDVDHPDAGDDLAQGPQDGLGQFVQDDDQGVVGVDGEPGKDRSEKDERREYVGQYPDEGNYGIDP